ncbi:MAG: helix-turn-helix transcriptional regulator [Bacteroidales bacterium]|nr:helix-turn-helix transcriptional regulator [Bacteroidales bacterium]
MAVLSNTIRVERARKKITQAELAEAIHVSRQTIHAVEAGKFVPSIHLALRMAKYFEIDFDELFQLDTEKENSNL